MSDQLIPFTREAMNEGDLLIYDFKHLIDGKVVEHNRFRHKVLIKGNNECLLSMITRGIPGSRNKWSRGDGYYGIPDTIDETPTRVYRRWIDKRPRRKRRLGIYN